MVSCAVYGQTRGSLLMAGSCTFRCLTLLSWVMTVNCFFGSEMQLIARWTESTAGGSPWFMFVTDHYHILYRMIRMPMYINDVLHTHAYVRVFMYIHVSSCLIMSLSIYVHIIYIYVCVWCFASPTSTLNDYESPTYLSNLDTTLASTNELPGGRWCRSACTVWGAGV